jgi:hypothetical protein
MRRLLIAGSIVGASALAFGAGVALNRPTVTWDHALKEHPCTVRVWQPSVGYINQTQDPRDCLALSKPQRMEGQWNDTPSGGFEDRKSGKVYSIDAGGMTRAQLQWIAGTKVPPTWFSNRSYRVALVGRVGQLGSGWADVRRDVLVVDKVLSASVAGSLQPAN